MSTHNPQVVDSEPLTGEDWDYNDYYFSGRESTVLSKRTFLDAYRDNGSIYHAAQVARIDRSTIYKWLAKDAAFLAAMADAQEDCADNVETSVYKKALAGDSLLMMFYLKAYRPRFRDKVMVDIQAVQAEIAERVANNPQLLPAPTTNSDNEQS
jgi:hypothetical protein